MLNGSTCAVGRLTPQGRALRDRVLAGRVQVVQRLLMTPRSGDGVLAGLLDEGASTCVTRTR